MYTAKERRRYNEDRDNACQRLGITKNDYNYLRRKGEALRKEYVEMCNGTDKTQGKTAEVIEMSIADRACLLGLNLYFQTDPRGSSLYLDKQPIPENNYTQAVCIY